MKYFFIAGERSGDQHTSRIISSLREKDAQAEIKAWGGDQMARAGAELLQHYKEYSVMGFWEVVTQILKLRKLLKDCKQDIRLFSPDVLVLVDFPGFNLRVAAFAHRLGIKTCYFISPKIWAWNTSRIKQIKASIDQMLVILPFEEAFYQKYKYPVTYVGNPTLEQLDSYVFDQNLLINIRKNAKNIAVLPGSRKQEIKASIHIIQQLAEIYEDYVFLVAAVDNADSSLYSPLDNYSNIQVVTGKTYELLKASNAAIVTSGTATLEAALLDVPQVVVYKTSLVSYWLAKWFVKVKFISLVNLIACKEVVRELIQAEYNPNEISAELESLLNDEEVKKRISEGYSEIREKLGVECTSKKAANAIYQLVK